MGYRIDYGSVELNRKRKAGNGIRIRNMIAISLFAFAVFVRLFWPNGSDILREYLLPGDLSVAEEAFSDFMNQLHNGEELREAALVFCRTILYEVS